LTRFRVGSIRNVKRLSSKVQSLELKITESEVYQLGEPSSQGSATWAGNSIILKLTTSDGTIGLWRSSPHATAPTSDPVSTRGRPSVQRKGSIDMERNIHEWHKHDFLPPSLLRIQQQPSARFDIACWDIAGKALRRSRSTSLSEAFSGSSVRVYANGWYEQMCHT